MKPPKLTGPWDERQIEEFLGHSIIPLRLAAVSPNGWPVVASLWFEYQKGGFYCASKNNSRIVQLLEGNPQCGFEVAGENPPYFGVRGQGIAEIKSRESLVWLQRLTDRYIGTENRRFNDWLMRNAANEVLIYIRPVRVMSWDYRQRMSKKSNDSPQGCGL